METIQEIPLEFNKNGLKHQLLKKEGNKALYVQKFLTGEVSSFEIHMIRIAEANKGSITNKSGKTSHYNLPKREILASNEEFGKYGWSFESYERADKVFRGM